MSALPLIIEMARSPVAEPNGKPIRDVGKCSGTRSFIVDVLWYTHIVDVLGNPDVYILWHTDVVNVLWHTDIVDVLGSTNVVDVPRHTLSMFCGTRTSSVG